MLIAFNKPFGVLSQFTDQQARATLKDFIATLGVYPAGRLDYDSEGLLLLTDDGALAARISDPRHKWPKTYVIQVEGTANSAQLAALQSGVKLKDGVSQPAHARQLAEPPHWLWPREPPVRFRARIPTDWLELQIREGRNRQVRRMSAAVGLPTLRLIRTQVGEFGLGGLAPGQWRVC